MTIQKTIAIASGKGGVGKSTIAVLLAYCCAQKGLKVGLLDADVQGPSISEFLPANCRHRLQQKKFVPAQWMGIQFFSMGFLLENSSPALWRGPILSTIIRQLFSDVLWGSLDILIVDLPPGTGDIHMTLKKQAGLSGVVCVTSPDLLSEADALRLLRAYQMMAVPLLGVIENMRLFKCPACDVVHDLFSNGSAGSAISEKMKIPLLGVLPFVQGATAQIKTLENSPLSQDWKGPINQIFQRLQACLHLL